MGVGAASSKLKRAAKKMVVAACASFSSRKPPAPSLSLHTDSVTISDSSPAMFPTGEGVEEDDDDDEEESNTIISNKNNKFEELPDELILQALALPCVRNENSPPRVLIYNTATILTFIEK